ncbi:hypothetical protein GC096_04095 [Paenibacillus sp. LMG 31461]|uniref:TniQ domain-containing protein n=1 Tax=Paenibacillus plantarum TaxID=2654975 RepID=A0ABX1X496_9BACL|nr:TniQ family protein [Paenibacillus plantarum]NOU63228.1 hypothetical protein [Paenibacillus plantarum]
MKKILDRNAIPEYDESLKGFIQRVSENNNLGEVMWIYNLVKLKSYNKPTEIHYQEADLSLLSDLLGLEVEKLLSLTFIPDLQMCDPIVRNTIIQYGIGTYKTKVCPLCIEEGWVRKMWHINLLSTCPNHSIRLIEVCPNCNKDISPYLNKINVCKCGFNYQNSPIIKSSDQEVEFSRLIHQKLFIQSPFKVDGNNPLLSLEFNQILYLFIFIGHQISFYFHKFRIKYNNSNTRNLRNEIVMKTYQIFTDYPSSFHKFLDELALISKPSKNKSYNGIHLVFGNFHRALLEKFLSPEYRFLLIHYNEYLERNLINEPRRTTNGRLRIKTIDNQSVVLRKFLYPEKYNKQKLSKKLRIQNQWLVRDEICGILGIGEDKATALIKSNLVSVVRGPDIDGYNKWIIKESSVYELLNKFSEKSRLLEKDDEIVPFNKTVEIFRGSAMYFQDFISLVLNSKLTPIKLDNDMRLSDYSFNKIEVYAAIENEYISITRASEFIDNNLVKIRSWVQKGFIESKKNGRGENVITKQAIEEFKSKYISLYEIMKKYNVNSSISMLTRIINSGVSPISGPSIDKGKGYLFLRNETDLLNFEIKKVISK